jgi:hypothetical protein
VGTVTLREAVLASVNHAQINNTGPAGNDNDAIHLDLSLDGQTISLTSYINSATPFRLFDVDATGGLTLKGLTLSGGGPHGGQHGHAGSLFVGSAATATGVEGVSAATLSNATFTDANTDARQATSRSLS